MRDGVIDEIGRDVLDFRHTTVHPNTLRRWALHLREVVQPQLEELGRLQADRAAAKAPKAAKAVQG
jgi:hypothetical protein